MAKRKKSKNRKQKVADAKENGIVEQEAASVTAPVGGAEVNGKVELESPAAAAVPGMYVSIRPPCCIPLQCQLSCFVGLERFSQLHC